MFNFFITVITNILSPMIMLIAIGYFMRAVLKIDTRTLSRLTIYVFVPPVLFVKIVQANVAGEFVLIVISFVVGIEILMSGVGAVSSRILKLTHSEKMAFGNSLIFFNSGNYGLPLAELAFVKNPVAMAVQIFTMLVQNVTGNSAGVFRASMGAGNAKSAILSIFKIPLLYVILLATMVRLAAIPVPAPIWTSLNYLAGGFVAIALITLGAQLADIDGRKHLKLATIASVLRLLVSPVIAIIAAKLLGLTGIMAQSLVLGVSTPTAVNTAIIAREFNNEPDLAAQTVFICTVLSGFTITIVLLVVQYFFPA